MVEEVTFEESVKCEDVIEEECFPSYRTIYQPMKVKVDSNDMQGEPNSALALFLGRGVRNHL